MKRKRSTKAEPSKLSPRARAILARTAAARRARDAAIAGVVLEGGPPELGPKRDTASPRWLERDIALGSSRAGF